MPFWQHFFPRLQKAFPGIVDDVTLDDFVWAVNDVERSFIRVEADEATYNLHIILRFELEQALVNGDLPPAEVPAAWNEKFRQMFGLTPPNYAQGCLQDIHWSMGGPRLLSDLHAGQPVRGPVHGQRPAATWAATAIWMPCSGRADFSLAETLAQRQYPRRGAAFSSRADCAELITDEPLSHKPLLDYLWKKYGALYRIAP